MQINDDVETIENLHRNKTSDSFDSGFYTRGISTEAAVPPQNTGGRIYTMLESLAENQRNRLHENLVELGVKRDTSDESEDKTKLQ